MNPKTSFQIYPIGNIRRDANAIQIRLDEPYRAGLRGLGNFSHVNVFWWSQGFDEPEGRQHLLVEPSYAEGRQVGVFACRSPRRPNLIMVTVCKILSVDEVSGVLRIANIDAFDGTPVLDLKPYFPVTDRVMDAHIPDFLVDWPESFPEEGIGLREDGQPEIFHVLRDLQQNFLAVVNSIFK